MLNITCCRNGEDTWEDSVWHQQGDVENFEGGGMWRGDASKVKDECDRNMVDESENKVTCN